MTIFQIHFAHGGVVEVDADRVEDDGRVLVLHKADGTVRMRDNDILSCHAVGFAPEGAETDDGHVFRLTDRAGRVRAVCRGHQAMAGLHDTDGPRRPLTRR